MSKKTKRTLSAVGAVIVALALLIGGTYAYTAFDHRSNPFRNDPNYQGRLIDDYEEKEWEVDKEIKKEISVKNMGGTEQFPGKNWGDIFVRLKLKEHMDITPIEYVYHPATNPVNKVRFMTDKDGNFVRFTAGTGTSTVPTTAQLTTIRNSTVWNNVIADPADRAAFTSALTAANFTRLRGYYDNQDYWYVITKEGDPNGQYGSFVVVDKTLDVTRMQSITGSDRATGINYGTGMHIQDPSDHDNEECLYPTHYWDEDQPEVCDLNSHYYAEWELGPSIVMVDDWDGLAVDAWILNPITGWATWGNALKPGEQTDLLLKSVTPIRMPDGDMLYVIHVDMQCTDRMDMLRPDFWKDHDGDDDPWDIEGIVGDKGTAATGVEILGGDRTMTEGETDKLRFRVFPPNASNKNVRWNSSDPNVVTVDDDGNIVAVGPGDAVITVTTDDGDFEDSITITVVPATVPVTGVTISVSPTNIAFFGAGDTRNTTAQGTATVAPAGASNQAVTWHSSNPAVATVSSTGLVTPTGTGTTVITARSVDGNIPSNPVTVTVSAGQTPGTGVTIDPAVKTQGITVNVGQTVPAPAFTVAPPNTTDTPTWSRANGTGQITINAATGAITGVAPGNATVTITLRPGVFDTVNVTILAPATGVTINTAGVTVKVGETVTVPHTITPAGSTSTPAWTTAPGTGSVSIVAQDGQIRGETVGNATVTVTVNGHTANVPVTIIPATGPYLDTKNGAGPYGARHHATDDSLEFGAMMDISSFPTFAVISVDEPCAIKFDDIFPAGFDTTGVTVRAADSAMAPYFTVGTDKAGDKGILGTYPGLKADWDLTFTTKVNPTYQINLILEKDGFTPTPIIVIMSYELSYYM